MKNNLRADLAAVLLFLLIPGVAVFAQKARGGRSTPHSIKAPKVIYEASTPVELEQKRRIDTFNFVWNTLNTGYFDSTFNNLNWGQIKTEYLPKVEASTTDKELYAILGEMIAKLGRSHLVIIPPEVYETIEKAKAESRLREKKRNSEQALPGSDDDKDEDLNLDEPLTKYGIGVDLRLLDGKFVITRLHKDSAAGYAGLKTGYIIEAVNDISLSDMIKRMQILFPNAQGTLRHIPYEVVAWFLNGEKDSHVKIKYFDENDQAKEVSILREKQRSETVQIGPNFPESQLEFETESLTEDVGLIRFDVFAIPVIAKFCDSLTQLKNKKAIIIDLRGNHGGVVGSLIGLGGMLTDKSIDLGTSIYRARTETLTAKSKVKNFKGKVVFLVDNQTVSAAEMFASALQESKRALVVGDRTAGEALPSLIVKLPTGASMQYPIANYRSHDGKFLEGTGVAPDLMIALDRKSLLQGKDNQIEAALRVIHDEKAFLSPGVITIPAKQGNVFQADPPPVIAAPKQTFSVKGDYNGPPPPPPPKALPKPLSSKVLAEVTVKAPPDFVVKESAPVIDSASTKILSDFAAAVGGGPAYGKIDSYSMEGSLTMNVYGGEQVLSYIIYRKKPNKYVEIIRSASSGEVRDIRNGKTLTVQTEFGLEQEAPFEYDVVKTEVINPIYELMDLNNFRSLKFLGVFDRDGRKTNVISGETAEGASIGLAFDVETGMLRSYTDKYSALSYDDFRKVGDVMLPFKFEKGPLKVQFSEIKINPVIDESVFSKKINCYDREN